MASEPFSYDLKYVESYGTQSQITFLWWVYIINQPHSIDHNIEHTFIEAYCCTYSDDWIVRKGNLYNWLYSLV